MQAARSWQRAISVAQVPRALQSPDAAVLGEMQAWRDSLGSAPRAEVAAVLVATAFAAKQLKPVKLASMPFPEALLHGRTVAGYAEARTALALYVDQVNQLRDVARSSPDRLDRLTAPGLEILALSIHAVSESRQLFLQGQCLWRELLRGVTEYPAVYRALLNPRAGAEQIADDLFLP